MRLSLSRSRKITWQTSCVLLIVSVLAAVFFSVKISERYHYIDELIANAVTEKEVDDRQDSVISIARAIYERTNRVIEREELDWYADLEAHSFFNVTAATSLRYGGFGIEGQGQAEMGPCGTMSKVLLNALWRLEIPARKLQIPARKEFPGEGHTLVEFYHDGEWRVIAPSNNAFVWRKKDGTLSNREEIQTNQELFSQVFAKHPRFKYTFDHYRNIRWEKLPSFMVKTIRAVLGEERFRRVETPRLYDQPRRLFFLVTCTSSVFFGLLVWFLRPRRGKAKSHVRNPDQAGHSSPDAGRDATLGNMVH